jgi:hypothetical protein
MTKPSSELEKVIAVAVYSFARAGVEAGLTPASALRLTAFTMIESVLGREATKSLGLPYSTGARWRAELASVDSSSLDEASPPVEMLNDVLGLLGLRDLRVVREPRAGEDDGQG